MTATRTIILCLLFLPGVGNGAETVIYRCAQEDGTIAFQETPCTEAADEIEDESPQSTEYGAPADTYFDFVNPFDEDENASAEAEQQSTVPPSQDRAECEQTTRDAIDAIDAKLQNSDSREDDREHLAELLELTRQLRACKQL